MPKNRRPPRHRRLRQPPAGEPPVHPLRHRAGHRPPHPQPAARQRPVGRAAWRRSNAALESLEYQRDVKLVVLAADGQVLLGRVRAGRPPGRPRLRDARGVPARSSRTWASSTSPRWRWWPARRWARAACWPPACDIVLAAASAKFGQPEIKGGVFNPVAAALLPRLVGPQEGLRDDPRRRQHRPRRRRSASAWSPAWSRTTAWRRRRPPSSSASRRAARPSCSSRAGRWCGGLDLPFADAAAPRRGRLPEPAHGHRGRGRGAERRHGQAQARLEGQADEGRQAISADWEQVAEAAQVYEAELMALRLREAGIEAQVLDQSFQQEPLPSVARRSPWCASLVPAERRSEQARRPGCAGDPLPDLDARVRGPGKLRGEKSMISFELSDEHQAVEGTVRDWAARDVAPKIHDLDREHRFERRFLEGHGRPAAARDLHPRGVRRGGHGLPQPRAWSPRSWSTSTPTCA